MSQMNDKQQFELQEYLKKKQKFIQLAIKELQQGNKEKAIRMINIDAGFNIEMIKIIEGE